jgi:Flp pilus assembly pilin Flp
LSLRSRGGDARDEEPGNSAAAAVWPYERQFFSKPKGETKGMLDKLVVKLLTLKMRLSDERGQDIMEYAILTGGIAIALIVALALFTGEVNATFERLHTWMAANIVP